MEMSGKFSPKSHPGEALLRQAKRLTEVPELHLPGAAELHCDWDRDELSIYSVDFQLLRKLPLREAIKQLEDKLR